MTTKPSLLRRSLGNFLFAIAPLVATTLGVAGFFASAILIDSVAVISALALALSFGVGYGVLTGGARLLRLTRPRRRAAITSAIGTVLLAVCVGVTAFVPIDDGFRAAPAPEGTEYWDLPSGSRIAYLHESPKGEALDEAVVFLHGGPGTPGEGLPPGADLLAAAGFDVYSYDQLGAGRSTRLDDVNEYTVARQVEDLEAIRIELGADRLNLIGRSWGASLAAQYIAAHPDRVARAVFVSPGELWPAAYSEPVSDPWRTLPKQKRAEFDELFSTPRVILMSLLQGFNPNAAHSFVGDAEADALLHAGSVIGQDAGMCPGTSALTPHHNPQGFYVNQLTTEDFAAIDDPRPALREVTIPVLILRGECDFLSPVVADEYEQVFADARLVAIPGAGHAVSSQAPPEYLGALTRFLVEAP